MSFLKYKKIKCEMHNESYEWNFNWTLLSFYTYEQ